MPALPVVPNVLRYQFHFTVGSDTNVGVRAFFAYSGPAPSSANLGLNANPVDAACVTNFVPVMVPSVIYTGLTVTDLSSSSGGTFTTTGSHPGTRTGGSASAAACALFNMTIARRYRGGKPRHYFPFGSSTDIGTAQTWSATAQTAFTSAWNAVITAITSNPPSPASVTNEVNVSYYFSFKSFQNPVTLRWKNVASPRTTPLVDAIASRRVNPAIGTQRRRIAA